MLGLCVMLIQLILPAQPNFRNYDKCVNCQAQKDCMMLSC